MSGLVRSSAGRGGRNERRQPRPSAALGSLGQVSPLRSWWRRRSSVHMANDVFKHIEDRERRSTPSITHFRGRFRGPAHASFRPSDEADAPPAGSSRDRGGASRGSRKRARRCTLRSRADDTATSIAEHQPYDDVEGDADDDRRDPHEGDFTELEEPDRFVRRQSDLPFEAPEEADDVAVDEVEVEAQTREEVQVGPEAGLILREPGNEEEDERQGDQFRAPRCAEA